MFYQNQADRQSRYLLRERRRRPLQTHELRIKLEHFLQTLASLNRTLLKS